MKLLLIIIGVLVGAGIGIAISYTLLKNQFTKAGREALKKAEEDGELIKKEKILQAKEKFLQLKAEHEKSCNEKNNRSPQPRTVSNRRRTP
jgi:ribonuclease Y